MECFLRTFEHPLIAFVPLGILLVRYLGGVRLPWGLPGGFVAILAGTAIAWTLHLTGAPGALPLGGDLLATLGVHPPVPSLGPLFAALGSSDVWARISMIIVSQAFTATPKEHAPAVVLGLLPGLAAWGWLLVEMTQLGLKASGRLRWEADLAGIVGALGGTSIPYVRGLIALKAGFMF